MSPLCPWRLAWLLATEENLQYMHGYMWISAHDAACPRHCVYIPEAIRSPKPRPINVWFQAQRAELTVHVHNLVSAICVESRCAM